MLTAEEALERLKKGNERFVSGQTQHLKLLTHQERAAMAESQEPFAIILGCSDSRVPAEMVLTKVWAICLLFVLQGILLHHLRWVVWNLQPIALAVHWSLY